MGSGKNLEIPNEGEPPNVPYEWISHGTINTDIDYLSGTYIPFFSVTCNNPWDPNGTTEVATDDPYVSDLIGNGTVYIGRIPVTSIEEAENYVNKLQVYYESLENYSAGRENEILLNCDITHPGNGCTGELVRTLDNNLINEHIPVTTSILDLKVSEDAQNDCDYSYEWQTYLYCPLRQDIFEDNLNSGASIMSILSTTGGPESFGGWFWATDNRDPENPTTIDFNLTNINTAMPFVIAPNCNQGEVMSPDLESTMRKLMVYDDGGIIGCIAPTNGSEQHANGYVLNRFNDIIFEDEEKTYSVIFKILKSEIETNYPVYEYFYVSLTFFGDPSMTPSIYKHRNGTLPASTTWSGNFIINQSVTVPDGQSLTILPGTNIFFNNGSSLTIQGSLVANGTTSKDILFKKGTGTGNWGGITFTKLPFSTLASSTLDYVTVSEANGISCLNGANVTIENSIIENCTNGIYIYNTEPTIRYNNIKNPNGHGIYGEASGKSPIIQGNIIQKTSSCSTYHGGEGIYFSNNTNPFITGNDIKGFNDCIYYGGGGVGYFTDDFYETPVVNNRLIDSYNGLNVSYSSYLYAGGLIHSDPPAMLGNYNSIFNTISYDAIARYSGVIMGEYNWWGSDGAQTFTSNNGVIDARNPLNYNPWAGIQENLVNNSKLLNPGEGDDIGWCVTYEKEGRRSELIALCRQMLEQNSHPKFALVELVKLIHKFHLNNLKDYMDSLLIGNRPYKASVMNHLASIALENDRYNIAVQLYDAIISNYPGSELAVNALFEKFFAALLYKNDRNVAGELLDELEALGLYDDDFLLRLAAAESLFNSTPGGLQMGKKVASVENVPKKYELLGNYPNPFNPSTKISYALPYHSSVELVIYDILGRQIKSFNIFSQPSGKQFITWNGTNDYNVPVSSGIYLYRISIKSLENTETFVKTSKLLLMK